MRWGILGPLQVTDDAGEDGALPTGRVRVLLAALLMRANHAVSVDELSELLWDGAPPPGAAKTVRVYVVRLRRVLGPSAAQRIVTQAPGYLCRAKREELDLLMFEQRCRQAEVAAREQDWARATRLLADALTLWRGTPLADVPSGLLRSREVPRLDRLRLQAVEDRVTAQMHLNRHEQLIPQLYELTVSFPLHERFHAQLMTALARCGRRAEALEAYRSARGVLVEELGIEPGPELRVVHQCILSGESEPACTVTGQAGAPSGGVVSQATAAAMAPHQLPAAPGHFTGRDAELNQLTALTQSAGAHSGTVVISAIDGMAGIGKTALAVHAAHRLAERFPGGQLFIDLHGYTNGYLPRDPGQALEWLLRALGVPAQQIPQDAEARAALYRQRLAKTSTLIVLDNALDEAQVRPLLPGASGCLVLVTSRRRLKGLDDARSLSLDLLPPQDAVALLRAVAGADRIPHDDPLAGEIAQLCGYLPLAVRIAGALLRHRPAWGLTHLAGLLRDRRRRVPTLSDGERDLATVFDLSYVGLDERHRALFRRLGLVPGPDADVYAAADLQECEPDAVTGLLEDLVDHNLLIEHAPGRYRLHDLMRAYARTLADIGPASDRDAAMDRLLRYYAHTAQTASMSIARYPRSAPDGPVPIYAPILADPEAARAWLRVERDNLEAAHSHACALALHGHALALAAGLAEILRMDGPLARALDLHQAAAETAQRQDRPAARAAALNDLGSVRRLTGDLPGAVDALTQALETSRKLGHRDGEAAALSELGVMRRLTGDLPGADDALTRALEISRETGHGSGEAYVLTELGFVRRLTGDLSGAVDALTRALEIYRETGHRHGEAWALNYYAAIVAADGDIARARSLYQQALAMNRELDKFDDEAIALEGLADCDLSAGRTGPALGHLKQALEIYQRLGMALDAERVRTRLAAQRR